MATITDAAPRLNVPNYRLPFDTMLTPALLVDRDAVAHNIAVTIRALGGDANRWRPHVKTAKLTSTMHALVEAGVRQAKCATTLELLTAARAGISDVLVAYSLTGANAARVRALADELKQVRISVLVENATQVPQWQGSRVSAFIDVNPGMDRTGVQVAQHGAERVCSLACTLRQNSVPFRGIHYYDGHIGKMPEAEREATAHRGYRELMQLVDALRAEGFNCEEIITAGTPAMPYSVTFAAFTGGGFVHRVSPGTVVYHDASSINQLPRAWGYRNAVFVASRVVSHPKPGIVTCDAGHKTVSADAGVPTCAVAGHPNWEPLSPSEEHLPIRIAADAPVPELGEIVYLVPKHVCPTVNNFDHAVMVSGGTVYEVERVAARGREHPLLSAAS